MIPEAIVDLQFTITVLIRELASSIPIEQLEMDRTTDPWLHIQRMVPQGSKTAFLLQ